MGYHSKSYFKASYLTELLDIVLNVVDLLPERHLTTGEDNLGLNHTAGVTCCMGTNVYRYSNSIVTSKNVVKIYKE